jgi:PAS domain S-box-containing protein
MDEPLHVEYRYRRKDGSYVWVLDRSIHIRDERGAPVAWQGVLLDITDRKKLEEDLRASEAKYRTLVELLPAVVYIVSADDAGTPHYFSPYLETLTGYRPAEVLGRTHSWLDNVHPEDRDRVAAEDGHAIATGTPARIEYRCRRKDGSYAWVMDESIFLRNEGGTIVALQGVLIDITDRKQAEAALAEALEAAQAATRTKSLFLAMMSHELRTPLQAVLGYADFLLHSSPDSLTPAQVEDIGTIHRGAARMVALIEQLLDLSRMEAGRLALESKPVDLTEILDHVRQDVAPQLAAKELALHLAVPPTGFVALGDSERIRQILLNLVGNAVKFTEAGTVWINAKTSADGIEVAVRDTGIGIAAEALPTIFEEFRQVEGTLTRRYGGAGLGLAIAKKLADQMGGGITVESEPGVGSIFTLRLPAAPGH